MSFPGTWQEFLHQYEFKDTKQEYTNGAALIPSFRIEQMVEHFFGRPDSEYAEWETIEPNGVISYSKAYKQCSRCKKVEFLPLKFRFCPNCGRMMRLPEDGKRTTYK